METRFSPTPQDVKRYQRFRLISKELNHLIVKTIPKQAFDEIGNALGIMQDGTLVFESEDMTSVLMDCCLYDWFEDGKNLVQRYAEAHPAMPGTAEGFLLDAYSRAKYRILVVDSAEPDAGLHCHDLFNREQLFLMDIASSRNFSGGKRALATRTIPLGEYYMTGGAALPAHSGEALRSALTLIDSGKDRSLKKPGRLELLLVRACLADGGAERISYEDVKGPKRHRR